MVEGFRRCWVTEEEKDVREIGTQLLSDIEEEDSEDEKNA